MRSTAFWIKGLAGLTTLILFGQVQAAIPSPDVLVKTTTEEVLAVISQTSDRRQLLQLAETKVLPHFDFTRMTTLAVGKSWRQASPQQQQALEKQFRDLLVRTYTNALAGGKRMNATVAVAPLRLQPDSTEVTVKTRVTAPGSQPIPIDYQMEKSPSGWKVYDVVVADVSLVTNYRDSFGAEIAKSGIDGLIKSLAEKNGTLADSRASPKQGQSGRAPE
jgi:phospholipid transport system substrate-binding protein